MLSTFGRLELDGSEFRRVKPLLLLAYLSLRGPTPRRYLAEIFWPEASDPMNSLSVALSQLRRGVPGSAEADEERAWSTLTSDAQELRRRFAAGDVDGTVELYRGPFLEGVSLELGAELEEWLYDTREELAAVVREALLRRAEVEAGQGRFEEAGVLAARAYRLPGAAEPEPEALVRFHALLAAGRHAAIGELRKEAEALGVSLRLSSEEARASLRQVVAGRSREIERLGGLAEGEWAWVRGTAGMGKTTLLKQLEGTYLPARAGLPYATVEPLLGDDLGENPTAMLRRLAAMDGTWLFDDWELMDPESRALLERLRSLRPLARVVVASDAPAPFTPEVEIALQPLTEEELRSVPGAWDATGGLPELVGAHLREEPLDAALERRLGRLSGCAGEVFLALALLEVGDPGTVRRALDLSGTDVGNALDELLAAGLVEASGRVRARPAALHLLESRPGQLAPLALRLARQREGAEAFPLYRRARGLWDEADLEAVARAYNAWADELLRRGFARRAVDVLAEAPASPQTTLWRARALERAGQYREALEELAAAETSPLVSALRSALYWRIGEPERARETAELALEGEAEARAEGFNTLGILARSREEFAEAASHARRAAALWKSLGNQMLWVGALNNVAIARTLAGEAGVDAFEEALEAAGDNGLLRARTLLNLGWMHERSGSLDEAEHAFRDAAGLANEAGVVEIAAWAWNNLGVLHHKQGATAPAREAYGRALELARRSGEPRIVGTVMANEAELTEDIEAWQEALRLLERSGHEALAENHRMGLPEGHAFQTLRDAPAGS